MSAAAAAIGPIDFIGDDNGNPSDRQIGAFRHLVGSLRPGASHAIQDIETSYSHRTTPLQPRGETRDGTTAFFRKLAATLDPEAGLRVGAVQFSRNNIVVTKAGVWQQAPKASYGHTHPSKRDRQRPSGGNRQKEEEEEDGDEL